MSFPRSRADGVKANAKRQQTGGEEEDESGNEISWLESALPLPLMHNVWLITIDFRTLPGFPRSNCRRRRRGPMKAKSRMSKGSRASFN